jgi:RNA polymerase sigma-70 factor, ECF subfamily
MIRRTKANAVERLGDEELMALVRRQDARAFEALYDRHGGPAYSLAYRIVGSTQAAEDVTQEAFLSIWRSRTAYDPARGGVRTWLLGVVRNRAVDALRRNASPTRRLDADDDDAMAAQPAPERTDVEALRHEQARELRGALRTLPTDQLEVITLAYFGGFTQSEIAQMLGAPLGTVKGRMRLALEKVRSTMEEVVA